MCTSANFLTVVNGMKQYKIMLQIKREVYANTTVTKNKQNELKQHRTGLGHWQHNSNYIHTYVWCMQYKCAPTASLFITNMYGYVSTVDGLLSALLL